MHVYIDILLFLYTLILKNIKNVKTCKKKSMSETLVWEKYEKVSKNTKSMEKYEQKYAVFKSSLLASEPY